MPPSRRVVTGVDSAGKSILITDDYLPERGNGISAVMIYTSESGTTVPIREARAEHSNNNRPAPYGTGWSVIQFAPRDDPDAPPPRLHTTDTLDYLAIRSGEVTMLLDDGAEVLLKAGDYLVQGGVPHGWVNRSSAPCVAECFFFGVPRNG